MTRFIVVIEGRNCAVRFQSEKRWIKVLFRRRTAVSKVGFFATRCVVAATETEAEKIAIENIARELKIEWQLKNVDSDPPVFLISDVRLVTSSDDPGIAAQGFTFYRTDERH